LASERGLPFVAISDVTGEGLEQLRHAMATSGYQSTTRVAQRRLAPYVLR
jgi:hypothetical protein